jgi:hypothetical protein
MTPRFEGRHVMQDTPDNGPSSAPAKNIGWERVMLASALAAVFLIVLAVGGTALVTRAFGVRRAWTSSVIAVGMITAAIALAPFARLGRGPLAMVARRLPPGLDGGLRRRPLAAGLAGLLTVVAVVQVARLSCFMADPALRWGSAYPPLEFGVRHMCLSAYVYAADLTRGSVPNIYAEEHYPAYSVGEAEGMRRLSSGVANLAPYIRDAFEYPPPFLLLPRAALVLTNDFLAIRTAGS